MLCLFLIFAQEKPEFMEHPENDKAYKGLKVNEGVEALGTVNPYLSTMFFEYRGRVTAICIISFL